MSLHWCKHQNEDVMYEAMAKIDFSTHFFTVSYGFMWSWSHELLVSISATTHLGRKRGATNGTMNKPCVYVSQVCTVYNLHR